MRLLLVLALLSSVAHAQSPPQPGFFSDVQMLWFDSEYNPDFQLAPRFAFGFDDVVGARVRYWSYDHASSFSLPIVDSNSGIDRLERLDFDVIDLEALTHLRHEYSDFLLSGGARIAHIDHNRFWINRNPYNGQIHEDSHNFGEKTNLGGVTFAAEGRTLLVSAVSAVYGGRLSLLQGDWSGSNIVDNEQFTVTEAFAGIEASYGHAFTRVSVELQDWNGRLRSGLGPNINVPTSVHAFGFTGYGFDLGWMY